MPVEDADRLIKKSLERITEDKIWQRWLHHQDIGFNEFRDKLMPRTVDFSKVRKKAKDIERRFKQNGVI